MATVLTEEEKRKKAIGFAFPQNPPPGGSIYGAKFGNDAVAQEPTAPSRPIGYSFPQNPPPGGSIYKSRQPAAQPVAEQPSKPIGFSFPQNPPPGGSIYKSRPTQPGGLGVVAPATQSQLPTTSQSQRGEGSMPGIEPSQSQRGEGGPIPSVAAKKPSVAVAEPSLNAPWYSREYATAANMSDKNGLELERGRAAGASGIPSNDPVRRLAVSGTVSTGMAPDAPVAQMAATTPATTPVATTATAQSQTAKVGMPGANVAAPGTVESPIVAKPNQSVQQAAKQADMQAGQTATTAMQQPLGKDIGFGIRKLDMPDGSSMYMGEGPNPSLPSASGIAYAPVARQINMPVLNRGMGVFSSMADFANQAGKAYGAIAQNKSDNKSARIGMDVVKMNSDISQNALKLGMDQQRADSDMGLNAVKQAQANLQNNSMSALESARQEYLAAGDDPAKQQAAARKLRAFGVLDKNDSLKDNFLVVGGEQQYDQNGNRISDTPRVAIDLRTMQPIGLGQGAAGQQAAKPSAKNIEALKSDPSLAAAFDQQFGAGASKQYIQGK